MEQLLQNGQAKAGGRLGGQQTVGCWESVKMSEKRDGVRVN